MTKQLLPFSFPCPFLWDEILKQKQIAEQRDLKAQLVREIPVWHKIAWQGEKSKLLNRGCVALMNRIMCWDELHRADCEARRTPPNILALPWRIPVLKTQEELDYDAWIFDSINSEMLQEYGVQYGGGVWAPDADLYNIDEDLFDFYEIRFSKICEFLNHSRELDYFWEQRDGEEKSR